MHRYVHAKAPTLALTFSASTMNITRVQSLRRAVKASLLPHSRCFRRLKMTARLRHAWHFHSTPATPHARTVWPNHALLSLSLLLLPPLVPLLALLLLRLAAIAPAAHSTVFAIALTAHCAGTFKAAPTASPLGSFESAAAAEAAAEAAPDIITAPATISAAAVRLADRLSRWKVLYTSRDFPARGTVVVVEVVVVVGLGREGSPPVVLLLALLPWLE
jgi:hypothetical protein